MSLIRTLETIENQIKSTVNNKDVIYDVNNAIKCIIEYMKHQIREVQQKKAKSDVFNDLDEVSAFWLQDFAKVLPVKFWEGEHEYFGKRGMSLHVDMFFIKKDSQVKKKIYLTAIYRCDQTMKDVLSIADVLLAQFKPDNPLRICMSNQTLLVATMGH